MRRLLITGALAAPLALTLLAAPAAQAAPEWDGPRPTPQSYTVTRSFGPFDGDDPTRRISISCRDRDDEITARRATVTPLRDVDRDRARRSVVRVDDLRVSRDRSRLSALVEPTGREGRARVTLQIRCRDDDRGRRGDDRGGWDDRRDDRRGDDGRWDDRGPRPTPLGR